jgi:hypothetical protein
MSGSPQERTSAGFVGASIDQIRGGLCKTDRGSPVQRSHSKVIGTVETTPGLDQQFYGLQIAYTHRGRKWRYRRIMVAVKNLRLSFENRSRLLMIALSNRIKQLHHRQGVRPTMELELSSMFEDLLRFNSRLQVIRDVA